MSESSREALHGGRPLRFTIEGHDYEVPAPRAKVAMEAFDVAEITERMGQAYRKAMAAAREAAEVAGDDPELVNEADVMAEAASALGEEEVMDMKATRAWWRDLLTAPVFDSMIEDDLEWEWIGHAANVCWFRILQGIDQAERIWERVVASGGAPASPNREARRSSTPTTRAAAPSTRKRASASGTTTRK